MIENTVYQLLANMPELAALIGDKVYFEHNPNQNESQFLIYQKSSHLRPLTIDGAATTQNADFQIDIYSKSENTARNIRDILAAAIHGKSNAQYADNIQMMYVDSDFSGYDTDTSIYRITMQISIHYY